MRDAVVACQLHAFGVNQNNTQVIRGVVKQQTSQNGIDAHRFTRTRSTGDEHVRHTFHTGNHGDSRHIATQAKTQGFGVALVRVAFQNIAQGNHCHFFVGHFDADITMPRHGCLNADARRG